MELLLFFPQNFTAAYSCANISVDSIAVADRIQPINGPLTIVLYIIFEALAMPCVVALFRHRWDNSCYMLMFVTSLVDALTLNIVGLMTGVLGLFGIVYCQLPLTIYIAGTLAESLWAIQTDLNMLLALNRCLEYLFPRLNDFLFQDRRVLLWIALVGAHFIYYVSQVNVIFVPMYFSWFYNPYTGYRDDLVNNYFYPMDVFQNYFAGIALPSIYGVFSVLLFIRLWAIKDYANINKEHKLIFLQVFIINLFNFVSTFTYIVMAFGVTWAWLTEMMMYSWLCVHGMPGIIYLALNRTIRRELWTMTERTLSCLCLKKDKKHGQMGDPMGVPGPVPRLNWIPATSFAVTAGGIPQSTTTAFPHSASISRGQLLAPPPIALANVSPPPPGFLSMGAGPLERSATAPFFGTTSTPIAGNESLTALSSARLNPANMRRF